MPVAVPLLAAGVGAAGAIASSRSQSNAAKSAAQASQNATDAAVAEQRRQYDLSRADMQPWLRTGQGALAQLGSLYGISGGQQAATAPVNYGGSARLGQIYGGAENIRPGSAMAERVEGYPLSMTAGTTQYGVAQPVPQTQAAPAAPAQAGGQFGSFWQSPDYQFRMNESLRALTARNAALGIQDSGAAQRSAVNLAGNLASGEFNNYANRLASLAGVGQTAAQSNAASGQNFANNYSSLLTNNAQNLASSYQQRGAANAGLWSTLAGIGAGGINRGF